MRPGTQVRALLDDSCRLDRESGVSVARRQNPFSGEAGCGAAGRGRRIRDHCRSDRHFPCLCSNSQPTTGRSPAAPGRIPAATDEAIHLQGPIALGVTPYTTGTVMVGEADIPAGARVLIGLGGASRDRQRPRAGRGAGPLGTCEAKAGAGVRRHGSEQRLPSWWRHGRALCVPRIGCNSACPASHRALARNAQWESRCTEAGATHLPGAPVSVAYRCDQSLAGRPSWFVAPSRRPKNR